MQSTPSEYLLDHLPREPEDIHQIHLGETSLIELLEAKVASGREGDALKTQLEQHRSTVPGIHAYVNRLLRKWSAICTKDGVALTKGLSSHSFRRGAAQSANGSSSISTPWIMDRGGWSMTAVSKAFNYIVNTKQEDQAVGKTLAGWDLKSDARLPTFEGFDDVVVRRVRLLQGLLFGTAQGFSDTLSLRDDVVEVFMAVIILHYHDMVQMAPSSPYITRVRQALGKLHITESEVASWCLTIHKTLIGTQHGDSQQAGRGQTDETRTDELLRKQTTLLEQQTKIVDGLLKQVRLLSDRVQKLEGSSCGPATPLPVPPLQPGGSEVNRPAARLAAAGRRKSGPKSLMAVWLEWFCKLEPYA